MTSALDQASSPMFEKCTQDIGNFVAFVLDEEHLTSLSLREDFKGLLIETGQGLVDQMKQHFLSTVQSLAAFILQMVAHGAAPESLFDKKFTGVQGMHDGDGNWAHLAAVPEVLQFYVFPALCKQQNAFLDMKTEDGSSVRVDFAVGLFAAKFLRFGVVAAEIIQGTPDADADPKTLASTAKTTLANALPALRDVAAACSPMDDEPCSRRLKAIMNAGIGTVSTYSSKIMKELVASFERTLNNLGKVVAEEEFKTVERLVQTCDQPWAGDQGKKLLDVVNGKAAGALFDAWKSTQGQLAICKDLATNFHQLLRDGSCVEELTAMLQTLEPLIKGLAEPSEGQVSILKQSGVLLGNLTVIQAQLRQMDPGETRAGLLKRCAKGFRNSPFLTCHDKLRMLLPEKTTS